MNLKEKFKKTKGITLIALVVTIIVLLLLAGISISMLTGQNGILNRAAEAKEKTAKSQKEEKVKMAVMEAISNGGGILSSDELKEELINYGITVPEDVTSFPYYFEDDGLYFKIYEDGKLESGNLITFKVDGYYTFTAPEGKTFEEWLNSDGWKKYVEKLPSKDYYYIYLSKSKVSFKYIGKNGGYHTGDLALNQSLVNITDEIRDGENYSLKNERLATDFY